MHIDSKTLNVFISKLWIHYIHHMIHSLQDTYWWWWWKSFGKGAEKKETLLDTPSLLKGLWLADPLQKSSSFFMVASFSQLGVKKLANQYILPKAVNRRLYGSFTPLERGLLSWMLFMTYFWLNRPHGGVNILRICTTVALFLRKKELQSLLLLLRKKLMQLKIMWI